MFRRRKNKATSKEEIEQRISYDRTKEEKKSRYVARDTKEKKKILEQNTIIGVQG